MDRLKTILIVLKKYHFWALCLIVLVATLACWWRATTGLADLYRQNKSNIDAKFNDFTTKIGENPPNDAVISKKVEQEAALKQKVFRAWEVLYDQQRKVNTAPSEVGEEFKKKFDKLKPNEELDIKSREVYQNFIKLHLPTLLSLVDARRPAPPTTEPTTATSPDMAPGSEEQFTGVVEWSDSDYSRITGRFKWLETPSTAEIRLVQEDLWVYEALLRVIKNINRDATSPSNAVVKTIDTILIGKEAVGKDSEESVLRGVASTASAGSPPGGPPAPAASLPTLQETNLAQLNEGRYVDNRGNPLPPGAKSPHEEFKMMPIYMSLVVDQRQVPKLLVECANSTMPIEVRRIQLKAGEAAAIDLGSMATAAAAGPAARSDKPRSRMPAPKGSGGPRRLGSKSDAENSSAGQYDIPVDLAGVIYIYNPPDRQRLGMGAESAEPSVPGSAAPSVPATPPAETTAPSAPAPATPPPNPQRTGT
jgi:hypothetical protein